LGIINLNRQIMITTEEFATYLDSKVLEILKEMVAYDPIGTDLDNEEIQLILQRARIGVELLSDSVKLLNNQ